jgi:multidrug efflux pump subunit AcrA (membrane-fusion protein)
MKNRLNPIMLPVKKNIIRIYRSLPTYIDRKPLTSFFVLLGALLFLIIISSFLRKPPAQKKASLPAARTVEVYRIGTSPKIRVQAQIEKSGVVTITSLTQGVVQNIHFTPGEQVGKGSVVVDLSTNYQGGNAPSLQRQVAYKQYQTSALTFNKQKDIIAQQKELANQTDINAEKLREITAQSLSETQSLLDLNDDILSTLQKNLDQYSATNSAGRNDQVILQTKQLKSQFLSANNQLRNTLRNNQYQSDESNPPATIAHLQKDITIKQLELQEKTLALNVEISRLQYQIAQVNEDLMFPAAPFTATVQRVFVKVGQAVAPGTPLVELAQTAEDDPIVAIAYVPREIAQKVSMYEPSVLYMGGITFDTYPSYITQDAIQGTLYGIYYPVPDNYSNFTTEKGFIYIDVPIGYPDTTATIPYIPIDAIYQTQEYSYVYVIKNGKVTSKQIVLGNVFGRFVQVESGLDYGDVIILDRTVISGDSVKTKN